jgi:hypothetical protein
MDGDVVSVERMIPAEASAIFALVADAARHPEIDGSGTVQKVKADAPEHLVLGSTFGMSMRMGIPYSMVNTVIEFVEDARIAWQARPSGLAGRFVGGRIWRYELEPSIGGTLVRESWDISKDLQRPLLRLGGLPERTASSMSRTLERIEELVTTP